MLNIEEIGADSRHADGYVALFRINQTFLTGVLVVLAKAPGAAAIRKLTHAIESHPSLKVELKGYQAERRTLKNGSSVYEIKFAVETGKDHLIFEFLEYAKQSRVLTNPILSDTRNFKL